MKLKLLLALAASLLVSCDSAEEQTLRRPETKEEREAVAAMVVKLCEAANPKSDEEPEDMIEQAQKTAYDIICQSRRYRVTWESGGYHARNFELLDEL